MGQAISAVKGAIEEADEAEKEKANQDLDVLSKALDCQLNKFESELDAKFLNPSSTEKTEVPGIRVLHKSRFASVKATGGPSQDISGAIDDFLSFGKSDVDTKSEVIAGFKEIVTGALGAFMSNTQVGQHTEQKYFIFMQHNAVIRLDVMLYRWNFAGKGFGNNYESAFGYVVCKSIVDVTVLKTSEFVFLISEYAGDDEKDVVRYTQKMAEIYNAARRSKLDEAKAVKRALVDDIAD